MNIEFNERLNKNILSKDRKFCRKWFLLVCVFFFI